MVLLIQDFIQAMSFSTTHKLSSLKILRLQCQIMVFTYGITHLIGPPVQIIQALYMDNLQGFADYIEKPIKKRDDYPEMPPQNYLDADTRMAVAKYMLGRTN